MTYRTILVHCNDENRLPRLLDVAQQLAKPGEAHVVGLSVLPPIIVVPAMDGVPADTIEEHRTAYRTQMARMRDVFVERTRERGIGSTWLDLDVQDENPFGNVAEVVIAHARSADLVVASQANPKWPLTGLLDVAEQLAFEAGRPVLIVPNEGPVENLANRVVLAWNGSRESARSACDALPLLKASARVSIVEIDGNGKGADHCSAASISTTLQRHGVSCEAHAVKSVTGSGSTLLAEAQQRQAGLLVMGCYGHSRFRELVMGGATRYVLQHMKLPVLMSH